MYYDNYLCNVGGIRAQFKQWWRTSALNRYSCNYFPIKLVKTTDLNPNKLYLFCNFPHGMFSAGVYFAFGTDCAGYRELFPGIDITVVALEKHFRTPLMRDYFRILSA
ncbi:diacylglycerol O-acyltransferase 1-like [Frieseomelitta varia]|uniref:diacylglycerol O-acyltransferase 1-like n=1 Tax=Frieseomelitta varia TaxID=561572 RepID=UPI001CB68F9E|nr:diacylglycerol O-acyltransferase 1-like [Frieseomelitta varia]